MFQVEKMITYVREASDHRRGDLRRAMRSSKLDVKTLINPDDSISNEHGGTGAQ